MKVLMKNALAFQNFYEKSKSSSLPITTAYKIVKFYHNLSKDLEFYQERLNSIIQTYADRDEGGELKFSKDKTTILIKQDKVQECNLKLIELQNLEIDVDGAPLHLEELQSYTPTIEEMEALMPFIE